MAFSNVNVARSDAGSRRAADETPFVLRLATALLITTAASLVLIYASLWAALSVDPELLRQMY